MIAKELIKAKIIPVLVLLTLLAFIPPFSSGQYSSVRGVVKDEQGNLLKDAKITFLDPAKGTKFTLETNKKGEFAKIGVTPSTYRITVELEGYFPFESQFRIRLGMQEIFTITLRKIPPRAEDDKDYADGIDFFKQGKYEEAIESFKKAMEKFPEDVGVLYNLGVCYVRVGYLDEAISHLEKAIELSPEVIELYLALGECYFKKGEDEKALETFSRVLEIQQESPKAYYNIGIVYYKSEMTEQAIISFEKSIELDPKFSSAHYQLGLACVKIGDYEKAITSFEDFLRLEPDAPEANLVKEMIEKLRR